jgi:hypothetical protein
MTNFKVTFKKVEAGYYKLFLNGVEMLQYEKGMYSWYVTGGKETDAYWEFLSTVPRHSKWLVDTEGTYFTKSEIKQCWEALSKVM